MKEDFSVLTRRLDKMLHAISGAAPCKRAMTLLRQQVCEQHLGDDAKHGDVFVAHMLAPDVFSFAFTKLHLEETLKETVEFTLDSIKPVLESYATSDGIIAKAQKEFS